MVAFNSVTRTDDVNELDVVLKAWRLVCLLYIPSGDPLDDYIYDLCKESPHVWFVVSDDPDSGIRERANLLNHNMGSQATFFDDGQPIASARGAPDVVMLLRDTGRGLPLNAKDLVGLERKCLSVTHSSEVLLMMKGTKNSPRCGFSRRMVDLLSGLGVEFNSFDILENEDVRQANKVLHDWNTYPQLYAYGTLLGGLDVLQDVIQETGKEGVEYEIGYAKRLIPMLMQDSTNVATV